MNIGQKIAALFGAQYAFIRCSHTLVFRCERVYRIAGRWYTHAHPPDYGQGAELAKHTDYYWMLTPETRAENLVSEMPGHVASEDRWLPLTDELDAAMSMMPRNDNAPATTERAAASSPESPLRKRAMLEGLVHGQRVEQEQFKTGDGQS